MLEKIPNEHLPFRTPLINVGLELPRQMILANTPNVLVRQDGTTNTVEGLHEISLLLKELETEYGIENPGYNPLIVGQNSETGKALTVTKKIVGVGLAEAVATKSPEVLGKITSLYNGLTQYLEDKATNKQKYLSDIYGDHQYMYGHVEGETEDNIYLTDIAGEISDPDRHAKPLAELFSDCIILNAIYMYEDITAMTIRTGKEFSALVRIISLMNSVTVHNEVLNEAINLINNAQAEGKFVSDNAIEELTDAY